MRVLSSVSIRRPTCPDGIPNHVMSVLSWSNVELSGVLLLYGHLSFPSSSRGVCHLSLVSASHLQKGSSLYAPSNPSLSLSLVGHGGHRRVSLGGMAMSL